MAIAIETLIMMGVLMLVVRIEGNNLGVVGGYLVVSVMIINGYRAIRNLDNNSNKEWYQ